MFIFCTITEITITNRLPFVMSIHYFFLFMDITEIAVAYNIFDLKSVRYAKLLNLNFIKWKVQKRL